MIFSEVYSAYFNAMAMAISEAQKQALTPEKLLQIISEKAFSESALAILPAIKNEEWLVMNKDLRTPIKHRPQMPLTILQKRWLKSLLTDPRMALFDVDITGLEDVEALFSHRDFVYFDKYNDGDPFHDERYTINFKKILAALKEKRRIRIKYRSRRNAQIDAHYIPMKLEYSSKDDKFRLKTVDDQYVVYINIARIIECQLFETYDECELLLPKRKEYALTFLLKDERNALDRIMCHFSDCRKETRHLGNDRYQVELWYESRDETEILIRILSFGPMIKVIAPGSFVALIKERLTMQNAIQK
ncbi:MAG: WYL domain-containing protein [Synergistaceae bacterium]|nr:WYL domain-containing protein [Synergistaceae bacterium]